MTDDDGPPMLVLSVAPASIAEAGGTSTVTVSTGSGSSTFPDDQTITLALLGTATETDDYTINSKSLTLPAGVGSGASTVTATVTGVVDALFEGDETVLIDATRGTGNLAVGTRQTLTIIDDDRHATGAPAITGTPQVGMDLTASAGTIADADGLTNVSYNYQWIRVDGGTETDISGETESTYTLAPADVDKTLKVRASFTDDAGFDESRTSDATDDGDRRGQHVLPLAEHPASAQHLGQHVDGWRAEVWPGCRESWIPLQSIRGCADVPDVQHRPERLYRRWRYRRPS